MDTELPRPSSTSLRLQGLLLVLWNGLCGYVMLTTWKWTSEIDRRRCVLYFQPFLPFGVMLWLWGVNVRVFERLHIPYEKLFGSEDSKYLLKGEQLNRLGLFLLTVLFTACASFLAATTSGAEVIAESVPWVLMSGVILLLLCSFPPSLRSSHAFFIKTLRRVMLPMQSVTFADFLMADVMTSLARSLADMELTACHLIVHFRQPHSERDPAHDPICYRGVWHANVFLAFPYLIRMIQCFRLYSAESDLLQLFNAFKYMTAFPVIFSSMMKHYAVDGASMGFWIQIWFLASVVNTAFSFYWDIEMDWDMLWFRKDRSGTVHWWPRLQPDPSYSPIALYTCAILTNFAIRIAWIYKLSVHLHYSLTAHLVVALLEVFRRCQWIFIRIECGLRKQSKAQGLKQLHNKV